MTYEGLRAFADTWGLVLLAGLFIMMVVWLFRRGASKEYDRAARIPMDADEAPARQNAPTPPDEAAARAPKDTAE
ncbi:MAG: cbb3-type cytochrome c oxidase subunit 3 [Pseudomonadota bacterium]